MIASNNMRGFEPTLPKGILGFLNTPYYNHFLSLLLAGWYLLSTPKCEVQTAGATIETNQSKSLERK
jgi:hypothetical protein